MKIHVRKLFFLLALIASLGLIPAGQAQILYSTNYLTWNGSLNSSDDYTFQSQMSGNVNVSYILSAGQNNGAHIVAYHLVQGSTPASIFEVDADNPGQTNSSGSGSFQVISNNLYEVQATVFYSGSGVDGGGSATCVVYVPVSIVPSLGIISTNNQIILSWPSSATNYVLQTITNLSSRSWSNLTNGIATVGGNYVFTNTVNSQSAFFRLQSQ